MSDVSKRPQVIRDLIELATYIAQDNLEASDTAEFRIQESEFRSKTGFIPGFET
ncbi:MAG: hypothetical protein V7K27_14190 [Nostoc sp.]|uniref:hypothetical protein n=1 Tax=Nostoc sp. TaxID=1180 RepID=UPI002FF7DDF1